MLLIVIQKWCMERENIWWLLTIARKQICDVIMTWYLCCFNMSFCETGTPLWPVFEGLFPDLQVAQPRKFYLFLCKVCKPLTYFTQRLLSLVSFRISNNFFCLKTGQHKWMEVTVEYKCDLKFSTKAVIAYQHFKKCFQDLLAQYLPF